MRPIRVPGTNFVFKLDGDATGDHDLPCQLLRPEPNAAIVISTWEPTPEERRAIAKGANVQLAVFSAQHPPVSLSVSSEREVPK